MCLIYFLLFVHTAGNGVVYPEAIELLQESVSFKPAFALLQAKKGEMLKSLQCTVGPPSRPQKSKGL